MSETRDFDLDDLSEDELRRMAGRAVQDWTKLLAKRLSPDDAWRLLLAGGLAVLLPAVGNTGAADILRELADEVDRDSDAPKVH